MFFKDHRIERTKKGEIMDGFKPLQQIDYAHRKTDQQPGRQDGSGAIIWVAVAALCWIVILGLCAKAGYFN